MLAGRWLHYWVARIGCTDAAVTSRQQKVTALRLWLKHFAPLQLLLQIRRVRNPS